MASNRYLLYYAYNIILYYAYNISERWSQVRINLLTAVILMILVSSCVDVDVNHKIKRTGQDVKITIRVSGAYGSLLLDKIQRNISNDPLFRKCIFEEGTDYISWSCKDLDYTYSEDIPFEVFDPKRARLTEELRFPYYYYTYNVVFTAMPKQATNDRYSELWESLVDVKYYVEVFGEIVETNGQKTGPNTVLFTLSPSKATTCNIVFRDLFIFTWFGFIEEQSDLTKAGIIFGVLVLIVAAVAFIYGVVSHKKDQEEHSLEDTEDSMYCPHCGKPIQPDSTFCKFCGRRV